MAAKKSKLSINFLYQTAYQILTVIMPLITAPYIARVLGPENNGIYTYTYAIVNYFVVFAALGIEAYGNRLIAQAKARGQEELNKAFSGVYWMHFIASGIATVAYLLYAFIWSGNYRTIALIQSVWVIAAIFDINWLFFGLEEFQLTVRRNFIIKIISVVAIFSLVRAQSDLWIYTAIMGLAALISRMVLWLFVKKHVAFVKVDHKEIFSHLKPLSVLFLAVIATSIYRMIDKVMLGWYGTMVSLASYEYADKMIKLVITLITALGTVMLPRMSSLYAEGKDDVAAKYMKSTSQFMFVMAFALAFGLAGISNEFMPILLGPGYDESVMLTKVLCITLPIMGWNNLIRTQVLMPKEKDRIYTFAVWAGAIVNIILNYILIHLLGAVGAAIATVIAYIIVGVFQTFPIRHEFPIGPYLKYTFIPIISGIVMFI
ncbi:MAG: flippase, partial [Aeriscardovia sp.]|nr:flippase [Aeriscardovia sp.]